MTIVPYVNTNKITITKEVYIMSLRYNRSSCANA